MNLSLGTCRLWQISQGKLARKKPEGESVGDGEGFQRRDRDRWTRGERYASSGGREIGWEIVGMRYECEEVCEVVGRTWWVRRVEGDKDKSGKTDGDSRTGGDRHLSFTLDSSSDSHLLSRRVSRFRLALFQPDQVALKSRCPTCPVLPAVYPITVH